MANEEAERYFIVIGQKEIGPYPLPQILRLRAEGKLESAVRLRPEQGGPPILLRALLSGLRKDKTARAPWVVAALLLANLLVYLALGMSGAGWVTADPARLIENGSNFAPYTLDGEPWRLFTAMFLHGGLLHLLVNLYTLYDLGRLAEKLFGRLGFLALYLLAGLAGGIASVWWNPWVNSVGASGAIFGVMGGLLVYLLDQRNGVPASVMKPHAISILAMTGYTVAYGLTHDHIDNAAHIGGFLAGMVCGLCLGHPLRARQTRPAVLRRLAAPVTIGLVSLALYLQTPNHGPEFRAEQVFQSSLKRYQQEEKRLVQAANQFLPRIEPSLRKGEAVPELAAKVDAIASDWHALAEELGRLTLAPASPNRTLQHELVDNARLRAEFLNLLANAARYPETANAIAPRVQTVNEAQKANLKRIRELAGSAHPAANRP
ncbi:MAG: rhomboid family intramembrane serine protease [Betaproteobacteria bacterium]|nr:rhomboid family intramembrane serine protease [Betaproteobacteria bacterium]